MSIMTPARARPLTTGTLRNMLRDAVSEEDYGSAAVLRDELKHRDNDGEVERRSVTTSIGSVHGVCSVCGQPFCNGHR